MKRPTPEPEWVALTCCVSCSGWFNILLKKVSGTFKACKKPEIYSTRKVPDTFFNRMLTCGGFQGSDGVIVIRVLGNLGNILDIGELASLVHHKDRP